MSPALQFVVLTTAGWLNRRQQDGIDYLREENRILREQLGHRPLRLIVNEYVEHYHHERSHQGLGNQLLAGRCHQPERTSEFDGANASADC